jgi:sugar (pentulose or hexulose) kinase
MLWLREQDPTIFDRDRLYAGAGELAFHALTGVWRQDACNALQMGCYRVLEDRLDSEPLAIAGVSPECVAPLREGHRTAPLSPAFAAATGLPDGVPVAGPYMDHEAGYLSTVHVSERPLQVSLGTAWVGNFVTPSASSGWCPFQLVIPSPMVDGQALVIQPLLTGNVSWDWALTELLDRDLPTALVQADGLFSTRLLPPHGLMCIPWLTQANPYATGVRGGGGFWGVGPHVDRGDLLRALAAGMCFEFERVFAGVCSGGVVDCIVLGGGASRGNGFRRLLSALFPTLRAVAVQDEDVAGARGTLYAFDSPAGRAGCEDLDTVDSETRGVVEAGRQLYNTLFEREYGSHPLAAPYALR